MFEFMVLPLWKRDVYGDCVISVEGSLRNLGFFVLGETCKSVSVREAALRKASRCLYD